MIRRFVAVTIVLLLAAVGFAFWQVNALARWAALPHAVRDDVVVKIPRGLTPAAIADKLEAAGVVTDGQRFYWYARWVRPSLDRFKSGEYSFQPDVPQSPDAVIECTLPPPQPR